MDIAVIETCTALSLAAKISFPEVVMRLGATGVERYTADLVGRRQLSYGVDGQSHISPLAFDGPAVPESFDAASVERAIRTIQQGAITYQEFLRLIMAAGCSHYEVYITGRRAIYFGRDGSQHMEFFPN